MTETKVIKDFGNGHTIEHGKSSWDDNSYSIRNRYQTANGGFSPRSSSELPITDVLELAKASIENSLFSTDQILVLKRYCEDAIIRISNKD